MWERLSYGCPEHLERRERRRKIWRQRERAGDNVGRGGMRSFSRSSGKKRNGGGGGGGGKRGRKISGAPCVGITQFLLNRCPDDIGTKNV